MGFDDGKNSNPDSVMYDPVRKVLCTTDSAAGSPSKNETAYIDHVNIDGLTFENMNFTGSKGRIMFLYEDYYATINNVSVSNCSFETDKPWLCEYMEGGSLKTFNLAAVYVLHRMGVSNIEITENVIKNHYQGMIVYNVNNIYVNGNNITGTVHNAIAVQSVSSGTSSGNIEIVNNTISNMNERPVRFGALDSATIIVSENTIINAVDEDNEILRTQTCTQTTYTFENF